jgi:FMN-dependent NADH-azoreductase
MALSPWTVTAPREFAFAWKQANPGGQITYRDLGHNPVPLVTETFIAAVYTPPTHDRQSCVPL